MNARPFLARLHWVLSSQLGIDLRKAVRSAIGLHRYLRDLRRFRSGYAGSIELLPCLQDWHEEGGSTKTEYFWQDLLVARSIHAANPRKHVDVGSLISGFVAHVASFRDIEVFDVRPILAEIPGITFKQADLMRPITGMVEYCDSLSCLHALEHFGLGRYGDSVDPAGAERGLENLAALLKEGGRLYLSVPIGIERVAFNAHRVFDPRTILELAARHSLSLRKLSVIRSGGRVESINTEAEDASRLAALAAESYSLGVFEFEKNLAPHPPFQVSGWQA